MSDPLLERVCATYDGYLALGNRREATALACFVTSPEAPNVYDANHASHVCAASAAEIETLLEEAERRFAGLGHRQFRADPRTPASFEAWLCHEDYQPEHELQLLLEGPLAATPRPLEIRRARSDADWESVLKLTRLDHQEEARREGREAYPGDTTPRMVERRRAKEPALATWLAREEGMDCAFLSSWPGENGVGKVEDLFTHPRLRRRGIATALIARGVADCRERGAGPVLIGARPDDTPKRLYRALGFRPYCVTRSWLRTGLAPGS